MPVLLVLLCLFGWVRPSLSDAAPVREVLPALIIRHDMGGPLDRRQEEIRRLRRSSQPVEVRGRCYSACIMYLGLQNVCVSPGAVFGFHGPQRMLGQMPRDLFDHWSEVMARDLRPPLQHWFMARSRHVGAGGVMILPGSALIKMGYAPCRQGGPRDQIASGASGKP